LELSKKSWLLAIQFPDREQPSVHAIGGGDTEKLMAKLTAARDWAVPRAQLWVFGGGRATAEVGSEGRLSCGDDVAARGRGVLLICGPVFRGTSVWLLRGERSVGAN